MNLCDVQNVEKEKKSIRFIFDETEPYIFRDWKCELCGKKFEFEELSQITKDFMLNFYGMGVEQIFSMPILLNYKIRNGSKMESQQ